MNTNERTYTHTHTLTVIQTKQKNLIGLKHGGTPHNVETLKVIKYFFKSRLVDRLPGETMALRVPPRRRDGQRDLLDLET